MKLDDILLNLSDFIGYSKEQDLASANGIRLSMYTTITSSGSAETTFKVSNSRWRRHGLLFDNLIEAIAEYNLQQERRK